MLNLDNRDLIGRQVLQAVRKAGRNEYGLVRRKQELGCSMNDCRRPGYHDPVFASFGVKMMQEAGIRFKREAFYQEAVAGIDDARRAPRALCNVGDRGCRHGLSTIFRQLPAASGPLRSCALSQPG